MTEEQYFVKEWLNRLYGAEQVIEALERKREAIVCSMSGIGKYDDSFIPANTGENSSETKLLNYSELSATIEKKRQELTEGDMVTLRVIDTLGGKDSEIMKAILIDRYLNHLQWSQVIENQHYEKSRIMDLHIMALDRLYDRVLQEVKT